MSQLWHFCTFVLIILHQYLHISSSLSLLSADHFESWVREHGKTYTSEHEKQYRIRIFKENYDYITQHNNKANSSYKLSLNVFADLSHHEFKAKYLTGWPVFTSTNSLAVLEDVDIAQPNRVGICASDRPFQFYSRGIFTGPCCDTLDHSIFIEGYDHSRNGVEYWNVKNSWGTNWGINGYMHLAKWNGKNYSSCGINNRELMSNKTTKSSNNHPSSPVPRPNGSTCLPYECNVEQTCCCYKRRAGFCSKSGCCDPDFPVCCKVNRMCCPTQYPKCTQGNQTCFKKHGNTVLTVPGKVALLHARLSN